VHSLANPSAHSRGTPPSDSMIAARSSSVLDNSTGCATGWNVSVASNSALAFRMRRTRSAGMAVAPARRISRSPAGSIVAPIAAS
jgi:hypothetical protein